MAEDKKSFLLYCDLIHTISKMPNDKAGELFKHILEYVNDNDPQTDDLIIQLTFEPIKQQLKRDLIKYEEKLIDKSNNGKLGNLKRWHIDLYDKVMNKEITIDEAVIIATNRKTSLSDSEQSLPIAEIADIDTVNVTVTDTDNVTDILLKKETKKDSNNSKANTLIFPFPEYDFESEWNKWKEYKLIQHKFKYKSIIAEGMSLNKLILLSNNNFETAVQIINQSIENGWKGLFEIKTIGNHGTVTTKKPTVDEQLDERKQRFARELIESIENSTNADSQE